MRALYLIVSITLFLYADIEEKISHTQNQLKTSKIKHREISQRLKQLSREIDAENAKLKKLAVQIKSTKSKIATLKKNLHIKSSKLKEMEALYRKLKKREDEVNKKLSDILSQQIAISMIYEGGNEEGLQNAFEQNSDEIVFKEVLTTYSTLLRTKFAKTKKRFQKLQKNRKLIQKELETISRKLDRLKEEQQKLSRLKSLQSKTITNLKQKQKRYKYKLARIISEQKSLSTLLNKLHITKKRQEQTRIKETKSDTNVRRIGSSYQKGSITHYKGPKTIAPLKSYTIVQKFGTFVDPIYKIKIFNDSVKLKPRNKETMVRNVLPGKVVFASKTPMMGNVVIMEHRNHIHTIYANLSRLAPKLRVGTKLKAGNVIGRVQDTLTFEVTQNEKHINPTELFR